MKDKVSVGVIGLGCRGIVLIRDVLLTMKDVEIRMVCDVYPDRCEDMAALIEEKSGKRPAVTADYRELIAHPDVEAVIISASWTAHIPAAIAAMRAGKYVGCEVGGAYTVQQCWDLVHTYEETGTYCMMLENCCYGRDELMVANMVRLGVFGNIIHCEGGYRHDLRDEVANGRENRHYRLDNYRLRNCDNYPTHELGPIAQMLNIQRGNRMVSLTSTASRACGLHTYIKDKKADDEALRHTKFHQGDVVHTVISCANGETILLTLDTCLPRFYSRGLVVQGTRAMYQEDNRSLYIDNEHNAFDFDWKGHWNNIEEYREKYESDVWRDYLKAGLVGGHDGMDGLVLRDFIRCVKNDEQPPIDVYDMAAWMCISSLSEDSILMGSHPVTIPDFTNGLWITRKA